MNGLREDSADAMIVLGGLRCRPGVGARSLFTSRPDGLQFAENASRRRTSHRAPEDERERL